MGMRNPSDELELLIASTDLRSHPILRENGSIRFTYLAFLYSILKTSHRSEAAIHDMLMVYATAFQMNKQDTQALANLSPASVENVLQLIQSMTGYDRNWLIQWKFKDNHYSTLLLAELMFLHLSDLEAWDQNPYIRVYMDLFRVAPMITDQIKLFFQRLMLKQDTSDLLNIRNLNHLEYFQRAVLVYQQFRSIRATKVLVVATMSSGKSTLLNALTGNRMFPAINKACTSKIVEFANHPGLSRDVGVTLGTYKDIRWKITYEDIKDWNEHPGVNAIHLQGPIHSYSKLKDHPISFIDSPGTNNSRDQVHGEITYKILRSNDNDILLYVLNITNLASEDDSYLLKNFLEIAGNKKVIFLLNKADQLDVETDDRFHYYMKFAKDYIIQHGAKDPVIIPISAYAAGLFVYALEGQELTRKEIVDLQTYYELFQYPEYDMNEIARSINASLPRWELEFREDRKVQVGNKVLSSHLLQKALHQTGIGMLEEVLLQPVE